MRVEFARIWCYSILVILMISACMPPALAQGETGEFGEDYWFVEGPSGEYIETFDGWNFTVKTVSGYQLDCIILSQQFYGMINTSQKPIDIFSPLDIFVGVEDVADNPDDYPFTVTAWEYREITWTESYNKVYFQSHVGNNHLIPHNEMAYNCILNLTEGDMINITGQLVDLHGTNGQKSYEWETDTKIGDYDCEIILVDNITVNGAEWGIGAESNENNSIDYTGLGLAGAMLAVAAGSVFVYRKKQ